MAADHVFELDADVLALGAGLEGHPDNIAAALEGGFVICSGARTTGLSPRWGWRRCWSCRPRADTETARAVLPATIPLADAAFNVARASTLMLGLGTTDWELIAAGLDDRLHQPHRAGLYPRSAELLERARERGGAGGDDLRRRPDRAGVVPV